MWRRKYADTTNAFQGLADSFNNNEDHGDFLLRATLSHIEGTAPGDNETENA